MRYMSLTCILSFKRILKIHGIHCKNKYFLKLLMLRKSCLLTKTKAQEFHRRPAPRLTEANKPCLLHFRSSSCRATPSCKVLETARYMNTRSAAGSAAAPAMRIKKDLAAVPRRPPVSNAKGTRSGAGYRALLMHSALRAA